jgi:hypothetical protein
MEPARGGRAKQRVGRGRTWVEVIDVDGELERDDVADTDADAVTLRLLVALAVCTAAKSAGGTAGSIG